MGRFDNPIYDNIRRWIQNWQENGSSWDELLLARKQNENDLKKFLDNREMEDCWPKMSVSEWKDMVNEMKEYAEFQENIKFRGNDGALFNSNQDNGLKIPQSTNSCWQLYKSGLKGWDKESVKNLEDATIGILKRLNINTRDSKPIKGLVIGHVQSGKTANMEALMAMAADNGWNMFIILSGMAENLRIQTLTRMKNELNSAGNLTWFPINHPEKHPRDGIRAQDLVLSDNSNVRYFTVCLKHVSRLKKLIDWIHSDQANHNNMRIMIIDDEADQASISNEKSERIKEIKDRKGINKLIVHLVEDAHYKEGQTKGKAQCINYIMYTATPYANFLNETAEKSLYPSEFIWTLKSSKEYIGPNQIYGLDPENGSDGLDIKRKIPTDDIQTIKDIYEEYCTSGQTTIDIPESLKDAIAWFVCCVGAMRSLGYKKPISMLVHTSQKVDHHAAISKSLAKWIDISADDGSLIDRCRKLYKCETERETKDKWYSQISDFGLKKEEINDYPEFKIIEPCINELLSENVSHIKMDDQGDLTYKKSIHMVVDNCANNGINSENEYIRLAYPDPKEEPYPSPAPAFIVVGGNTLSRGLTIEGLVSTYFLRTTSQCDTLMQMGRWFGYRRGYELLPRIWMSYDTLEKFRFLSQLEIELREDLKKYMVDDVKPIDYGPRIIASPKVSWLKLTSNNHMQNAIAAEMDYSGAKPQTTVFDDDLDVQKNNLNIAVNFINKLGRYDKISQDGSSLCWLNVKLDIILDNLLKNGFEFSNRSRVFNEIGLFCEWVEEFAKENSLDKWSVVVAGREKVLDGYIEDEEHWNVYDKLVGKVIRSKRKSYEETSGYIDIGALRALNDLVADCDNDIVSAFKQRQQIAKQSHVDEIRKLSGKDKTPMLLIYRINKNSPKQGDSNEREDLKFGTDIIGLQIWVPGDQVNKSFKKKITVSLPAKTVEEEMDN